ncbi:MAG: hypothetical protein AABY83_13340 [Pseudomonadota bacterium]
MKLYTYRSISNFRSVPWRWVLLASVIAAAAVLIVLPVAGIVVALTLAIAAVGVVALLVGLPLYVLGWIILSILMLPFGLLKSFYWRRRMRVASVHRNAKSDA